MRKGITQTTVSEKGAQNASRWPEIVTNSK